MHFFLAFRSLLPMRPSQFVSDISDTLETKLAAIGCYASQFPPEKRTILDRVRIFNQQQGLAAGFTAGEVLAATTALGTRDLMHLLFAVLPAVPPREGGGEGKVPTIEPPR